MDNRPAAGTPGRDLDLALMANALGLGARNLGRTWPNPSVGAVVVRAGPDGPVIVGRGATQAGGRPHAERVALDQAGASARGATLYVTLEPCSHHGRTPPCAEAVVASGVARVVGAVEDPDPRVAGRGHALLRAAGIAVEVGVGAAEAARAHRGHVSRVTRGRPWLTLKLARTADGAAGRRDGARLLVTGEAANAQVHLARAHHDAVMVGAGTALADDPALTVRLPGLEGRSPVRVVLDTGLRTPPHLGLVRTARLAPTWIVTAASPESEAARVLAEAGARIVPAPRGGDGRLDLREAMRALAGRGLTRVLCEGGPALADALGAAGLVDELVLLTAPGRLEEPGIEAVGPHLAAALRGLTLAEEGRLGPDLLQRYERHP